MILASLEQADRYLTLHPGFHAAIGFLRSQPLGDLSEGRIEIAGGSYALVFRTPMRPRSEARLEAHRKFIDIQYVVAGIEEMGWRPHTQCRQPHGNYDADQDVQFFGDEPHGYLPVLSGELAIFFPEDAHAPLVGNGEVHKIVIKVPL